MCAEERTEKKENLRRFSSAPRGNRVRISSRATRWRQQLFIAVARGFRMAYVVFCVGVVDNVLAHDS